MNKNQISIMLLISLIIVTVDWYLFSGFSSDLFQNLYSINLLAAYWGFVFLNFLFIFSSRHPLLEKKSGLDKLLFRHTRLAPVAIFFLFLHGFAVVVTSVLSTGKPPLIWAALAGYSGIVILLLVGLTAGYYKKLNIRYEGWNRFHFITYPLYYFLLLHVFYHADPWTPSYYLWLVMVAVVSYLIMYRVNVFIKSRQNPLIVDKVIKENHSITTLQIKGKLFPYMPGQYIYLQKEGFHHWMDKNPFTISSSPHQPYLSVTVKSLGDCSEAFKTVEPGRKVFIDGPYGIFSHLLLKRKHLVFIAGGIGITPFISMLEYMEHYGTNFESVTLFWGNIREEDMIRRDFLEQMQQKQSYFHFVPVLSGQEDWSGYKGYIDSEKIKREVPYYKEAMYMICGPVVMKDAVQNELLSEGVNKDQIVYEFFSY